MMAIVMRVFVGLVIMTNYNELRFFLYEFTTVISTSVLNNNVTSRISLLLIPRNKFTKKNGIGLLIWFLALFTSFTERLNLAKTIIMSVFK